MYCKLLWHKYFALKATRGQKTVTTPIKRFFKHTFGLITLCLLYGKLVILLACPYAQIYPIVNVSISTTYLRIEVGTDTKDFGVWI